MPKPSRNGTVEVHLNTRGCKPMQPATAAALGRVFKAAYDQLADVGPERINPDLLPLARPIDSLRPDPANARLHGERNMEAIVASLRRFGQRKPIVVRESDMRVAAGNGTLAAAKRLGWKRIAASVGPMTDAEFAAYALADNRTAELAEWDHEVVKRLEALAADAGGMIGWTEEELAALRASTEIAAPDQFPEVDESVEVDHVCPKCGYQFSGGKTVARDQ